jgi:hypothetical protein
MSFEEHTFDAPTTAPRPAAHAAALTSSSFVKLPCVRAPDMVDFWSIGHLIFKITFLCM